MTNFPFAEGNRHMRIHWMIALLLLANVAQAEKPTPLAKSLIFHASFDDSADADNARGDRRIYTAASLKREKVTAGLPDEAARWDSRTGRYGGSLAFTKKSPQVVFFKGEANLPATKKGFSGTYSFWLKLDPEKDLPPGYVDPLQITDKKWNDASFFVDFTKDKPRTFRLGVFSNIDVWNPNGRKWEDISEQERPLVNVKQPPFSHSRWTHVGITFRDFNEARQDGVATLYLDGKSQGDIRRKQLFTWSPKRLAIMLGIGYVGGFDDLAIFDRALTASEIKQIFEAPNGIKSLVKK